MNRRKNCQYCGSYINIQSHGNRKYCDDNCSYSQKLEANAKKYKNQKNQFKEFNRVEALLKKYYRLHKTSLIRIEILNVNKMNWDIASGCKYIDGIRAIVVNSYAYYIFGSCLVRIWEI